jgi:DNA-directed RNA polymerase subunit RPC12/RpoP
MIDEEQKVCIDCGKKFRGYGVRCPLCTRIASLERRVEELEVEQR